MTAYEFTFHDETFSALPSGVLWWPGQKLLCVSDLHLGKSERIARDGGSLLPPFENRDTLSRLGDVIQKLHPRTVLCLGDSFDDMKASTSLSPEDNAHLLSLMAGRHWIWIEGNHDPGPLNLAGWHLAEYTVQNLVFRHIAKPNARAEISGHYHPKARISSRIRAQTRSCFLLDRKRIIMPAFGTYTGGLRADDKILQNLMQPDAFAILTGRFAGAVPMSSLAR